MKIRRSVEQYDYVLLGLVLLLCVFGLLMLTSAGSAIGFQRFGDSYFFVKRQIISFIIGIVLMVAFMNVDYRKLKKFAVPFLLIAIGFLVIVLIPSVGSTLLGGSRWISIAGVTFQPSEIAKLAFIIYLASWLESQNKVGGRISKQSLYQFIALLGVVAGLIILQPDMGTMSIIVLIGGVLLYSSGADIKHIIWMIMGGIGFFLLLIRMAPYRLQRFTSFLHPENDIQGSGYHIYQSLIAIGSGGIFGVGLGKSRQKFNYLPEAAGDSIFSVIAEELGLLATAFIIILFLFLFLRAIKIAQKAPDQFGKLLATGIIVWVVLQAFMNIAALSSLMPLTGIPLPFISYGGSALIIMLAAVGILLNISKQVKR